MGKRIVYILIAVVVVGWGLKWYFFDQGPVPETSSYKIDLAGLRAAAGPQENGPVNINGLLVGEGGFPAAAVIAGDSFFKKRPMVFTSFQITYADGRSVIVDTAHDEHLHKKYFSDEGFFPERFDEMQNAMRAADLIIATHEHMDHVGGIAQSPYLDEIAGHTALLEEQIHGPTIELAEFPEGALDKFTPLEYDRIHSPMPGIALLKAAGHSTGSQIIYVRKRDGQEFLFVGDIVWNMEGVRRLAARPRLVSMLFLQEDRDSVAQQIRAIHEFVAAHPDVNVVVAHDAQQWQDLLASGKIDPGFE